jgi:pimeloyl-ACP methyl ester carboxylesterase
VRFGVTIASLAAIEDGNVEGMIAWAPVASGRIHVRELRALRLIKDPRLSTSPRAEGGDEIMGYFFPSQTVTEMSAVDLLARAERIAVHALVVPRNETPTEEKRLIEHWRSLGTDVSVGMMRDPADTEVPNATLDAIVEWMGRLPDYGQAAPAEGAGLPGLLTTGGGESSPRITETPLAFGEGQRMFGVLTEPEGPVGSSRPALCFLNVGANHHVGPHRMCVELARELASLGYVAFRFDFAGLGDSAAGPGAPENRVYTNGYVDDVKRAMELLAERRGMHRFLLVGLCSGAYFAFRTAIDDPRVIGQLLLSPHTFDWREGDSITPTLRPLDNPVSDYASTRYYARALSDPTVWLRTLRGQVNVRGIARVLLDRVLVRAEAELTALKVRLLGHGRPQTEVEKGFVAACDRGVETLVVLSSSDGGIDMLAQHLGSDARKMRGRKSFALEIMEGADHTFTPVASQHALARIVTTYVTSRFP